MTQRWSPIYQFSIIVFWGTFLRHHFTPCARQGSTPSSKLNRPGVWGETMGRGKVFDLIQQSRICFRYSVWMIFFTLYLLRVMWMIVITYLRTLLIETGSRCFIIWVRRLNVGLFWGCASALSLRDWHKWSLGPFEKSWQFRGPTAQETDMYKVFLAFCQLFLAVGFTSLDVGIKQIGFIL